MAVLSNYILTLSITSDRYEEFVQFLNNETASGNFREDFRSYFGLASSPGNGSIIRFTVSCPSQQCDRFTQSVTELEERFLGLSI